MLWNNDLVEAHRMEGDGDDWVGPTTATVNGAVFSAGAFGLAADLDGVNDYIDTNLVPFISNLFNAFTVSVWIKGPTEEASKHAVLGFLNDCLRRSVETESRNDQLIVAT